MTNLLIDLILKDDSKDPTGARTRAGLLASVICICCNVILCCAKAAVGVAAGSVSIVADAVNNLSDASSNVVSLVGFKLASKPADADHPFGHGRFEYLAGLAVAVIVCALGLDLVKESVGKILHPEPSEFSTALVAVLIGSMTVKAWMMSFNGKLGRRIDSETLAATAADSRNDVVTTGVVLLCAVIAQLTGLNLDGFAGVGVGLFIAASGVGLIHDTVSPLLGRAPDAEFIEEIRSDILSYPGVLGAHDLMVHDYGPGRTFATAHVQMDGHVSAFKNHEVIDTIERELAAKTGTKIVLHYDPVDTSVDDPETWLARQIRRIDPRLSVHDLRLTADFMSFDLVKPDDCSLPDEEILGRAVATAAERWPNLPCSVTIDHGFLARA